MTKPRALKKQKMLNRRDKALAQVTADAVAKHIANSTKQLENYIAIQHYMTMGKKLPAFHGWPISPDFGLLLIDLIEQYQYDLVVEFGSGTSTVLIAQALANVKQRTGKPSQQVTFEHLDSYHAKTQALLNAAGLASAVQLVHAPLAPYPAPNGNTYSYYSCQDQLLQVAQSSSSTLKILVVVDGPPAATGLHARYPAWPVLQAAFPNASIDYLLDDYLRLDEKQIANQWRKQADAAQQQHQTHHYNKFEKEAFLISTQPAKKE